MVKLTRAQRVALKRVFDRGPVVTYLNTETYTVRDHVATVTAQRVLTYRGFRDSVQPTFGMDGAVTVKWQGMWLAIEADGYVHS